MLKNNFCHRKALAVLTASVLLLAPLTDACILKAESRLATGIPNGISVKTVSAVSTEKSTERLAFKYENEKDEYTDGISKADTTKVSQNLHAITNMTPRLLRVDSEKNNLISGADFETNGNWNAVGFIGEELTVCEDLNNAHNGSRALRFKGEGLTGKKKYIFRLKIEPNTKYMFSAWVKGINISSSNCGDATFGITDAASGEFLIGDPVAPDPGCILDSTAERQLVPTAYDNEWHLRGIEFNSGSRTEIGIAVYGSNSEIYLDELVLCKVKNCVKYESEYNTGKVSVYPNEGESSCKPENNLVQNFNFTDSESDFWETGHIYGNFVSVADAYLGSGKSLKYSAGEKPAGNIYIKWIDVQPERNYIFSFDIQVTRSGSGSISLLDNKNTIPAAAYELGFDTEHIGSGRHTVSVIFNSGVYKKVGICITDSGGEAYFNNIRIFEAAGSEINESSFDGYLYNGDFETGAHGEWENGAGSNARIIQTDAYGGNYCLRLISTGWNAYGQSFAVIPGTKYRLSFYMKSATLGNSLGVYIKNYTPNPNNENEPYDTDIEVKWVNDSLNWNRSITEFTAPEGCNKVRLHLSGDTATVRYLDDFKVVALAPITDDGYIKNGGFETGDDSGWINGAGFEVSDEDAHSGNYSLRFSGSAWPEFFRDFTVIPNTDYRLSLWIKDIKSTDIGVYIKKVVGGDAANFKSIWVSAGGDGWKQVKLDFKSPPDVFLMRLALTAGNAHVEKYIDDIEIMRPGDVNADGSVNANDIVSLRKYFLGAADSGVSEFRSDINNDGRADIRDLVALKKRFL